MPNIAISEASLPTACTRRAFIGMSDMDSIVRSRTDYASEVARSRSTLFNSGLTAVVTGMGLGLSAVVTTPASSASVFAPQRSATIVRVAEEKSSIETSLDRVIAIIHTRNESAGRAASEILEVFVEGPSDEDFEPISSSALGRAIGFMLVFSSQPLVFDAYEEENGCVTVASKGVRGMIEIMFRPDATIAVYGKRTDAPPIKMVASIANSGLPRDLIEALCDLSQVA